MGQHFYTHKKSHLVSVPFAFARHLFNGHSSSRGLVGCVMMNFFIITLKLRRPRVGTRIKVLDTFFLGLLLLKVMSYLATI